MVQNVIAALAEEEAWLWLKGYFWKLSLFLNIRLWTVSRSWLRTTYLYALSKSAYCFHISSFESVPQGLVVLVRMGKQRIPEWTAGC